MDTVLEPRPSHSRKSPVRVDQKLLVSRDEAAELLSISKRALDYLIANRTLPKRRVGARVLIPMQDLQRFARGNHPERLAG